jgi:multidrug efflux system outer membrane protein
MVTNWESTRMSKAKPLSGHKPVRWIATLAVMGLAGCSLIPTYERPVAPVPAHFSSANDSAQAGSQQPAAADIAWQDFFKDTRLQRLIELALQNNRDLRVAVLNIEQTRALLQVKRADELPTVNAGITGSRVPNASGSITSTFTAGLSVTSYEVDLFGRVRALSQAAQAHSALVASGANAYLNVRADDALLQIARDTVASREASLRLTQLKFNNEAASQLELSLAQSLLEGAKASLAQFTRQRAQDENALVLLLGQSLPADLPEGLPLTQQALLPDLPAGTPAELLLRRPDVRQAEQLLLTNNANIGAARAAFFPRISLTGSAGLVSGEMNSLFNNGSAAWSFTPQVLVPIFDAGRNQANLDTAKVGRDIAIAQYEKAIQVGFREVSDALVARDTYNEQVRAQSAQLAAEETRLQLTDLRYTHGASNALELLDAKRSLFATQQATVLAQVQQVQSLVNLYKVLGGGWTAK